MKAHEWFIGLTSPHARVLCAGSIDNALAHLHFEQLIDTIETYGKMPSPKL